MQDVFTETNLVKISNLVRDQFPAFYKEDGSNFIDFMKAYYEWLESPDNPVGQARDRYKNFDIDTAGEAFLSHFREKYMWALPPELLGNQRLLQKHILELYRSKGSQQATRLLFRLLFNEDIDFYIPSYDIFKLSDNTWVQPHYFEVNFTPYLTSYINKMVTGGVGGATAIIESYERRFVNGKQIHILFVSNVQGSFSPNEILLADGIPAADSARIIGSVIGLNVMGSSPGAQVGDTYKALNGEQPVSIVVKDTYNASGALSFTVTKPGTYYTLDAVLTIQQPNHEDFLDPVVYEDIDAAGYGFPKNPAADKDSKISDSLYLENTVPNDIPITGAGAEVRILSLKDTQVIQVFEEEINPYINVDLDDVYPFPTLPTSNVNTIISDSLVVTNLTVGSIDQIIVINPGSNYSTNVWIIPTDPHTSPLGLLDANNEIAGANALITGIPTVGQNLVQSVVVSNTGYNNIDFSVLNFIGTANTSMSLTGTPIFGGVGWGDGFYENTKSFLSDDKYLFDGHYYQDFSYVIKASMNLSKYIEILRKLVHPLGNAVYGDVEVLDFVGLYNDDAGFLYDVIPD